MYLLASKTANSTLLKGAQLPYVSIAVLVILHVVGVLGLSYNWQEWVLPLTPLNLVISALLVMAHANWKGLLPLAMVTAFAVGLAVEMLGVATGAIFGEYYYGDVLGPQLLEVPLVIGINWAILVYCTSTIAARLRLHRALQAAVAAALMVLLDVLMEPVAIALDFWQWTSPTVPLQNYLAWFVVAFGLCWLCLKALADRQSNRVGIALFITQACFFGILNFTL